MTIVKWRNHPVLSEMMNSMWNEDFHNCNYNRPAVNISEDNENFMIDMAIPGMNKEEIKIDVEKDMLNVSAEVEGKEDENNYTRREFNYGNFCRSFTLGNKINTDKIKADYKDGILSITLPKKEEAISKGPRSIKVS